MNALPALFIFALLGTAFFNNAAAAQPLQPVSSDTAVAMALKRNPEMNLSQQRIDQQKALLPTTFSLLQPDLIFEAPTGEDLRPGLLQVIDFPTVYSTQRQAQKRRIEIAATEKRITANNLIYRVRSGYNQLQFLLAKNRLLESQDSVYVDLIKVNDIRYRVGQISNLERINGESQYKRIQFNLKQTRAELRNAKYQFNLLIGFPNDTTHIPADRLEKIRYLLTETPVDTAYLTSNPLLTFTRQNELLSKKILQVERSKRIPGFVGGFLNQGTENTPWTSRVRFGITLPVWQWTYQGSINAAKKGIEIAQTQRQLNAYQLNTEYAKALADYRQYRDNLDYFESVGIREAEEILRNAKESFRLGSINYYAFLQNLELSFTIRQNYLETLKNYNQSVLNLMYIRGELLNYANL